MILPDLALIVIAAATTTAAVLIPCWYLHVRSYRRTLTGVRAVRNAYRAEARQLREERLANRRLSFVEHADTATRVAADEPVAYTLADPAYLPVFDGDNPAVAEYRSTAAALRRKAGAR